MKQEIEIGGTLKFSFETWENSASCADFSYKNRSTDHWCSDYDVDVPIDKDVAKNLILVLQSYIDSK